MTPTAVPTPTPEQATPDSCLLTPVSLSRAAASAATPPRRLNAYRHGLTAQVLILTPEEQKVYDAHHKTLRAHYKPQGPTESQLVQSIADSQWRLNRAMAIEDSIFALGLSQSSADTGNPEIDATLSLGRTWLAEGKNIALLSLYEQRIHRKLQKDQQYLREEQLRRQAETETDPPSPPAAKPTPPQPVLVFSPTATPATEVVETPPQRKAA